MQSRGLGDVYKRQLCGKVNEGLQQVLADGTFGKLAEKYGIADMVCLEKKGE